jgi:hypothetical protein
LTQENNLYVFESAGSNGIYDLTWPNLHISAHVAYMKQDSGHETKGEITFISERPTSSGHLRNSRVNLTSAASKKTFAKALAEREDQVDWDEVVEQLCVDVLRKWRTGAPVIRIEGNTDVEALQKWQVYPLCELGHPTVLYAPGSTGKSFLAQYIATLVDAGMSHNNLNVEPANVLYLDWETDIRELGSRVTMIRRGLGLEGKSSIWYRAMRQGLASDIERVKEICGEYSIGFIVIDSIGQACMGEPESADVVLRMFSALKSLEISSLCVDHTNKTNDSNSSHNLFGSVYKYNEARQIFEAKKRQHEDSDRIVLGLFHKKANNSKIIKPLGFTIEFQDGKIVISREDVRETELEEEMRIPDRIENILRNKPGGLAVNAIAEELDKTENHIRKELSKGKNTGKFTILGNGNYANRAWEEEIREGRSWIQKL